MPLRALLVVSAVFLFTTTVAASEAPIADEATPIACVTADKCCRVCDAGQACGNSCISRNKTCHKGRGCACNAADLCSF